MKHVMFLFTITIFITLVGCKDNKEEMKKKSKAAYDEGVNYYNAGKYDLAVKSLTESISLSPTETRFAQRANAYFMLSEYDKALADVNSAIKNNPKSLILYSYYYNRGRIYEAIGEVEKALNDYSASISKDKGFDLPYVRRGNILVTKKKYDEALSDYNAAIKNYNFYARVTKRSLGEMECPYRQRSLVWKIQGNIDAYKADNEKANDLARQVKEERIKKTGKIYPD